MTVCGVEPLTDGLVGCLRFLFLMTWEDGGIGHGF